MPGLSCLLTVLEDSQRTVAKADRNYVPRVTRRGRRDSPQQRCPDVEIRGRQREADSSPYDRALVDATRPAVRDEGGLGDLRQGNMTASLPSVDGPPKQTCSTVTEAVHCAKSPASFDRVARKVTVKPLGHVG